MDYIALPRTGRLWKSKADFFRPFRAVSHQAGENIEPLYDPALHCPEPVQPDLIDLNDSFAVLVEVFPDVQAEDLREMLSSISAHSRVQIVTEHLLKQQRKPVVTKDRVAPKSKAIAPRAARSLSRNGTMMLVAENRFQSEEYKRAVKQVLYQEFKNLSHSTIKAIMAEQNYSYTLSRPVLQQVAAKSWRLAIPNFWTKRPMPTAAGEHPFIIWQSQSGPDNCRVPAVKRTGSTQLDHEIHAHFVEPIIIRQRSELINADFVFASHVNEKEATDAEALFECECCYSSVPFEQIATCDESCHQLCFDCLRRSAKEALYGQSFAKTINVEKSTVRCFAPAVEECHGSVPAQLLQRALALGEESRFSWDELQARIANETLIRCGLKLQRCPFCDYAEVDESARLRLKSAKEVWRHIATRSSAALQIMMLSITAVLLIFAVPLLLLVSTMWLLMQILPPAAKLLDDSITRVYKRRRGLKFTCHDPICGKTSCTRCTAVWRDPHTCFENEKTSLRTAVEASATAAIKRTCPKCLLSFVKSSGCNKLVCNCGYTMCYICRQEITSKEGYSHFCQHFRASGGRCSECERCDLYGNEDEEAAIRRAAAAAEQAWRTQEGEGGEGASQLMVEALIGQARHDRWHEGWLDAIIDILAA